jgi:hypothetical protein
MYQIISFGTARREVSAASVGRNSTAERPELSLGPIICNKKVVPSMPRTAPRLQQLRKVMASLEGIAQHDTLPPIPLAGVFLNPRFEIGIAG